MNQALEPMKCRLCGETLIPRPTTLTDRARTFEDCVYHCRKCRVAFSNGRDEQARTLFYDDWRRNIPTAVHAGLARCLDQSLNEQARPMKKARLLAETSEDAVTWTVFRHLQQTGQLGKVLGIGDGRVLFWGAEPTGDPRNNDLRNLLVEILSRQLGESRKHLSEPDVLIVTRREVVTLEVKVRGSNLPQSDYRHFDRYLPKALPLFRDPMAVKRQGYYELTRNVVITFLLARRLNLDWQVINLGREDCRPSAEAFKASLQPKVPFEFLNWQEFCDRIPSPQPEWFETYLKEKGLKQ